VIGSVFAWVLGLGALFLSIYSTNRSGGAAGNTGISVLFGSIFGITSSQALVDSIVALLGALAVVAVGRPSFSPASTRPLPRARGVPVRLLGYLFFVLVGITAGEATQAVGALLLLGLVRPGRGSATVDTRPFTGLWLSAAIGVVSMWIGLTLAYADPQLPPSFTILAVATAIYFVAFLVTADRSRHAAPTKRLGHSE